MTTPPALAMLECVNTLLEGCGFTLDPVELSVLRRVHGVRSRLFPLRLGDPSMEDVEQALDRRGLSVDGRLTPPVLAAFELLAEHRVSVSITGAPGDLTALAVSDDVRAMTIVQSPDGQLRCTLFPAVELAETVVSMLPAGRAARGVPAAEPPTRRTGGGLLVASGQGRRGLWSDILGWVDTARGRRLVRSAMDRGTFAARYQPGGPPELTEAVRELLDARR